MSAPTPRKDAGGRFVVAESLEERFWAKVDVRGANECWPWTASLHRNGYGCLRIDGRTEVAHRVSVRLSGREIRPGECVRHRCDNPPCVNPAHLELGSHQDNMRDCAERGGFAKGEQLPQARLDPDAVRSIRERAAAGVLRSDLAREYGLKRASIGKIVRREIWRHVA